MFYRFKILLCVFVFFSCQNTLAQTTTGTLAVTATVLGPPSACTLDSSTPMLFPTYNSLNARPDDATSFITVTCTMGMSYDVGLDEGEGIGATEEKRMMSEMTPDATGVIMYGLFQNSNHTQNWGDIMGEDTMHMMGNNQPQRLTVYGELLANQIIAPGEYRDRVTIIVNF